MRRYYRIIPEDALSVKIIEGSVTVQDLIDESEEFFNDPLFDPYYNGVMDLRKAESKVSKLDLYKYVRYLDQSGKIEHAHWAVISDSPTLVALSQVFQRLSKAGSRIGVFGTVNRAAEFVERPTLHQYLSD